MPSPPVTRRELASWAMFDFANSSYTTVIVTVAFSVFFTSAIAPAGKGDLYWGLAITLSNVLVLLTAPLLGAAADGSGRKKQFLFATFLMCVLGTAGLYFVTPGRVVLGIALFIVSNVAFAQGESLIGAFLPEISTSKNVGRISGLGWGLGYFGGLASLLLIRPLMSAGLGPENFESVRKIWLVVALFFAVAALPTFLWLRERAERTAWQGLGTYFRQGLDRVATTVRSLSHFRQLARFLVVFFIFSLGFSTAITFSGIFARTTLGFTPGELVTLFLILQFTSAAGAVLFGWIQDRIGSTVALRLSLVLWTIVSVTSAACQTKQQFLWIGLVAGLGIGSLQASSRSVIAMFSPASKSGEFFGFWGLSMRAAYALGPLLFGVVSSSTGSQRIAVLLTCVFFLAGLIGLSFVNEREGREAASRWDAAKTS